QPAPIVRAIGCPVVYDLRAADIAAGGQGAPITPVADWVLFQDARLGLAIANLGGFCNLTIIPRDGDEPSDIRAMDVCSCNQLLDTIARMLMRVPFDEDGKRAAEGHVNDEALLDLDGVLAAQAGAGRSL